MDWAILNARTIAQMSNVNAGPMGRREDLMAQNIAGILDGAPPGSKMVLWGDNLRLARAVSLGTRLASRYGRELVIFGFAFKEEIKGEKVRSLYVISAALTVLALLTVGLAPRDHALAATPGAGVHPLFDLSAPA